MARRAGEEYTLTIADLRGGRNGCDPPTLIPEDQCLEALNVDGWEGSVANKRGGASTVSLTFSAGGPFGARIVSLLRHVPAGDETAAELWAVDASATPIVGRLAGAATWTAPTLKDNVTTPAEVHGASLGGFFELAYDSSQNRSHRWDGSTVRRTGLATFGAAPTGATDGGAGLTFSRVYRARSVHVSGTTIVRMSEPSATLSISITDDSGYTVTRPTAVDEGETHWDLEAADTAAGPFYRIARTAIATTTFDDTSATIATTNPAPTDGINYPPPSWKYIGTDDNRIYGAGCWETSGGYTTANNARFWFTPVLGSSDIGDAERIPSGNYVGLEEVPTAVSKRPFQGCIWVFAQSRIWKMVPTGVDTRPYQKITIRGDIGCIHQQTLVEADDEDGGGALYFWTRKGPYRLGSNGFQYCGADIEDISSIVTLGATTLPHGVYHADKHQVWWWLPVSSGNTPTVKVVFDTKAGKTVNIDEVRQQVRRGWYKHDGETAKAYCSVMFSETLGVSMSHKLKPYIGYVTSTAIYECDTNATDDAGTTFRAYVDTKEYGTVGRNHAIRQGVLIGQVASGVTITVQPISDFGLDTTGAVGTALLTAAASETRVQKRLDALQHAGVGTFRLRIGDAAAIANQWTIDAVQTNVIEQEAKS